jgi:hypothetical protein
VAGHVRHKLARTKTLGYRIHTDSSLASHRSGFEKIVKAVVFLGTTGLQWAYTSRHSKTAIVYLPEGWFGSLGWFLGLPFAPKGAISTTVFIFLIKRVLGVLTRVGKDIVQGARGGCDAGLAHISLGTDEKDPC